MASVEKLLEKFGRKERIILEGLIKQLVSLNWQTLDIKKLKGYQDAFRVRKGKLRIIFTLVGREVFIVDIKKRNEKTYK